MSGLKVQRFGAGLWPRFCEAELTHSDYYPIHIVTTIVATITTSSSIIMSCMFINSHVVLYQEVAVCGSQELLRTPAFCSRTSKDRRRKKPNGSLGL